MKSKISEEISGKEILDETAENKIQEEVDENIDDKSLIEEDTKEDASSVSNTASTEEKTEVCTLSKRIHFTQFLAFNLIAPSMGFFE